MKSYFVITSASILALFIFMSGCSIRRLPDNSEWEEEYSENYYWNDSGYSGKMPDYTPDYVEAWRMSKYYDSSEAQNYSGIYDTESVWRNDKTLSDNTTPKSRISNQPREISTKQAPEKSSARSLSLKRRAGLNKKDSKDNRRDKDSEASEEEDKLAEQRRKLREKMRRTRGKEKPEEEDDASNNQGRKKRLKDRK